MEIEREGGLSPGIIDSIEGPGMVLEGIGDGELLLNEIGKAGADDRSGVIVGGFGQDLVTAVEMEGEEGEMECEAEFMVGDIAEIGFDFLIYPDIGIEAVAVEDIIALEAEIFPESVFGFIEDIDKGEEEGAAASEDGALSYAVFIIIEIGLIIEGEGGGIFLIDGDEGGVFDTECEI